MMQVVGETVAQADRGRQDRWNIRRAGRRGILGGTRLMPLPNTEPSLRAFVRLRKVLNTDEEFARKLAELKQKYDQQFQVVLQVIRELLTAPQAEPPIQPGERMRNPRPQERSVRLCRGIARRR